METYRGQALAGRELKSFAALEDAVERLTEAGVPFVAYAHPGGWAWLRTSPLTQYLVEFKYDKRAQQAVVPETELEAFLRRVRARGGEVIWKKKQVLKAKKSTLNAFHRTVEKLRKTGWMLVYVNFDGTTLAREEHW